MLKAEFSVCLPKTQQRPMKQQLLMQLYCLLFAQTVAWLCAVWQNFLLPCEDAFRISSNFWSPGFVGVEKAFFMLFYLLSALYILSALSEVFPVLPKKLEWIHHYILYLRYSLPIHSIHSFLPANFLIFTASMFLGLIKSTETPLLLSARSYTFTTWTSM
jgi:hypothetical protein